MTRSSLRDLLRVAIVLGLAPLPTLAQPGPTAQEGAQASASLLCERAIASTERNSQIPPNLLGAIARVESGRLDPSVRAIRPWPWSINADGHGYTFESKTDAIAAVISLRARGIASIDVGCMQINLMHHPRAFSTLDEAFDPAANIQYSARFLSALHQETGAWSSAVAFYHSRTPSLALEYQRKVGLRLQTAAGAATFSNERTALANAWAATRSDGRESSSATSSVTAWVAALRRADQRRTAARMLVASVR